MLTGCTRAHTYAIEVIGESSAYVGPDRARALKVLVALKADGVEAFAVAEHADELLPNCRRESESVEIDTMWAPAVVQWPVTAPDVA